MKNTMRKLFSLALVVVMLACAIPFSAFALSELEEAKAQEGVAAAAYADASKEVTAAEAQMNAAKKAQADAEEAAKEASSAKTLAAQKAANAKVAYEEKAKAYTAETDPDKKDALYPAMEAAYMAMGAADTELELAVSAEAAANAEKTSKNQWLTDATNAYNTALAKVRTAKAAWDKAREVVALLNSGKQPEDVIGGTLPGGSTGGSNSIGNIVIGSGSTSGTTGGTIINGGNGSNSGSNNNTSGGIWLGNNNTVVNKDPYPVYLNIYLNGNVSTIAKKVDITKGIAADGYVDLADVKTVVRSYFNAKDSDGILYDGLYIFDGSFGGQYTTDVGRVDGYGNINEDRKLSTVNINVMIKNAVAKGSVASDPSNPKTGDMAFLTVTALVASAGALALVYANKKRFLVK